MKLSEIKTAPLSSLYYALGRTILAQGQGANFSKMLENREIAINKQIQKLKK